MISLSGQSRRKHKFPKPGKNPGDVPLSVEILEAVVAH
jgi:hypothetical protein